MGLRKHLLSHVCAHVALWLTGTEAGLPAFIHTAPKSERETTSSALLQPSQLQSLMCGTKA